MPFEDFLWSVPAFDQHAHNLFREEPVYSACFTEGCDPECATLARDTLFYRRGRRQMAKLLGCEPEQLEDRRRQLGQHELTRRCFEAAHLSRCALDDGLLPEKSHPLEWHQQFGIPCHRVMRIESLAERLIPECKNYRDLLQRFRHEIETAEIIGLKSIAAYRSGLEIRRAETTPELGKPGRLTDKAVIDALVYEAVHTRELPIQFHTGFGDPDLDLRLANPLHLRALIESTNNPIVLLHGGYPFTREAGFLASVYPHVYVDIGLAVPFLSTAGQIRAVSEILDLAPYTKVLYSSDASRIPDLYYLGAKAGRTALARVLEEAVGHEELTWKEAEKAAWAILKENAERLYGIRPG